MVYPDIERCREIILALWLAWLLYWIVSALYAKATRRRESPLSRVSYFVPLLAGAWLIGGVCAQHRLYTADRWTSGWHSGAEDR